MTSTASTTPIPVPPFAQIATRIGGALTGTGAIIATKWIGA